MITMPWYILRIESTGFSYNLQLKPVSQAAQLLRPVWKLGKKMSAPGSTIWKLKNWSRCKLKVHCFQDWAAVAASPCFTIHEISQIGVLSLTSMKTYPKSLLLGLSPPSLVIADGWCFSLSQCSSLCALLLYKVSRRPTSMEKLCA